MYRFLVVKSGRFIILCFAFIALLQLPPHAIANIIRVPEDYPTIPGAIEASASGDTIVVAEGVYEDSIGIENRSLTIASQYILDGNTSHIEATRLVRPGRRVLYATSDQFDRFELTGLTVTGGALELGGTNAARLEGLDVKLSNNRFTNCLSVSGGIYFHYCSIELDNNLFRGDSASNAGGALSLISSRGLIRENLFIDNSAPFGGALHIGSGQPDSAARWDIIGNYFESNTVSALGGAISVFNVDSIRIQDNRFIRNRAEGMAIGGAIDVGSYIDWCEISGNRFEANYAGWVGGALAIHSPTTFSNNLFLRNIANLSSAVVVQDVNATGPFAAWGTNNAFINNFPLSRETVSYSVVTAAGQATLVLEENDFFNNEKDAVRLSAVIPGTVEVTNNYWGYASGPYQPEQNPDGEGDTVAVGIDVLPFAEEPFTDYRRPEPFDLVSPEDGARPPLWVVTFRWRATTSPNPGGNDSLTYRVETALDSAFAFPASRHNAGRDTTLTVEVDPDSVAVLWWRVYVEDALGIRRYSSEVRRLDWTDAAPEQGQRGPPERWEVRRVYPNPFNSAVRVTVALPRAGPLRAAVYDLTGRCVALLHDGPAEAGERELVWRPGPGTASGVYLLRLSSGEWTAARKVVYLK